MLSRVACTRCGYEWASLKFRNPPIRCPECRSYSWKEPRVIATCPHCMRIWHPQIGNRDPAVCHSCGRIATVSPEVAS